MHPGDILEVPIYITMSRTKDFNEKCFNVEFF